jgi:hypothetical protein
MGVLKILPLTSGFVQLGHDVEAIIGSVSRPEIGLHQKVNLWTLNNKPSTSI